MKRLFSFALIFCLLILTSEILSAKDMNSRLGIGITNDIDTGLVDNTQISARYWFDSTSGVEFDFGFRLGEVNDKDTNSFSIGGKYLYNLKHEENLNLYCAPVMGITFFDNGNDDDTGFMLGLALGVEFFFSQLPNLSFNLEAGLVYRRFENNTSSFETEGNTLGSVGFHYYY